MTHSLTPNNIDQPLNTSIPDIQKGQSVSHFWSNSGEEKPMHEQRVRRLETNKLIAEHQVSEIVDFLACFVQGFHFWLLFFDDLTSLLTENTCKN